MRLLVSLLIGGSLGAALGYFGKCSSGMCLLTANPVRGAFVGAVLGLVFFLSSSQRGGFGDEATPHVRQISENEFEAEVQKSTAPVLYVMSPRLNEVVGSLTNKVKFVKV